MQPHELRALVPESPDVMIMSPPCKVVLGLHAGGARGRGTLRRHVASAGFLRGQDVWVSPEREEAPSRAPLEDNAGIPAT